MIDSPLFYYLTSFPVFYFTTTVTEKKKKKSAGLIASGSLFGSGCAGVYSAPTCHLHLMYSLTGCAGAYSAE